jgi:stage III sporulation protein AH
MILKKQTVWLLSMLAILVVLSGYYLVEGPNGTTSPTATQNKEGTGEPTDIHVNTKEVTPNTATPSSSNSVEDYFISYKMNRDARQEQELDRYMEVMTNNNAKSELREEAKKKYEELEALRNQQTELEELIKQAGDYKDVIVVAQDNMVRVIVHAKTLKPDKVVEIINIVKQHMKIPGNNITVENKA